MDFSKGWLLPILTTTIYIIYSMISLYVIVYVLFPKYFPDKRLIELFGITVLFMALLGSAEIWSYRWLWNSEGIVHDFYPFIITAIEHTLENSGILLGLFLGKKFYDAQMDLMQRDSEKKESELRLLKSQIDPHFLFNNLNTVDSLIDSDPKVAKTYLNKLSQLYRYLVRTKDDEVVPLDEELEFVRNYIYLLEQRFGSTYLFTIEQNYESNNSLIPPGALQTLLENVVKHNQGSDSAPITTSIVISDTRIVVSNNVKLKSRKRDSFGVGLTNLIKRYKYLSDEEVIINSNEIYSVTLPVLKVIG